MPIANCMVDPVHAGTDAEALARNWAVEIGVDPAEVTVNLVVPEAQGGARYEVMAWLHLPSLWTPEDRGRIQAALAAEICRCTGAPPESVVVMTVAIGSGDVLDRGERPEW